MTDPNAAPESLELQLLREIRDEMRAERAETRRQIAALRYDLNAVNAAQVQLGLAMGLDVIVPMPRPSPPPGPRDSWATPDLHDNGR